MLYMVFWDLVMRQRCDASPGAQVSVHKMDREIFIEVSLKYDTRVLSSTTREIARYQKSIHPDRFLRDIKNYSPEPRNGPVRISYSHSN
jgi:hypothetical protein